MKNLLWRRICYGALVEVRHCAEGTADKSKEFSQWTERGEEQLMRPWL
jgi:hypothetical protein